MKKVLCPFIILIFSTSVIFADFKSDFKELTYLQDRLNIVYNLLIMDKKNPDIKKELDFIDTQLKTIRKTFTDNKNFTTDHNEKLRYLSALSIINYFEIASLQAREYYNDNAIVEDFKGGLYAFYEGTQRLKNLP